MKNVRRTASFAERRLGALLVVPMAAYCACCLAADTNGDTWRDPSTGHKVVRWSLREGPNETFYFHQNMFTGAGDKMVFTGRTPHGRSAFVLDFASHALNELTPAGNVNFEVVAPKKRVLFYLDGNTVFSVSLDTLETRRIAEVPPQFAHGRGFSLNADETLLAGCFAAGEEQFQGLPRKEMIRKTFESALPNTVYTIDAATGEIREILHENTWFGHVQCSPADPGLMEFCHEGPECRLERMWMIRADGTGLRRVYSSGVPRTMITHEFWTPDGQGLWFDLQIPRRFLRTKVMRPISYAAGPRVYLAKTDLGPGGTLRYRLKDHERSWHYNIAPDGKTLCGDGEGRFAMLSTRGRWITLYHPDGKRMRVERLCSMKKHSYTIAPNTHFTPDGKWVVFTSDHTGSAQVYAVEVDRSDG